MVTLAAKISLLLFFKMGNLPLFVVYFHPFHNFRISIDHGCLVRVGIQNLARRMEDANGYSITQRMDIAADL